MLDHAKLDQLREILGDDPEGVGDIIDTFLDDTPNSIEALKAGLADGDASAVASAAHKIKGSSSTLGAMRLSELCKTFEEKANEGDLSAVDARIDELDEVWEATETALQEAHPVS